MKIGQVAPVYKNGEITSLDNYKPITIIIPVLSKLFERLIWDRLVNFLTKSSVLSSEQHGYVSPISIYMARFKTIKFVLQAWNEAH